MSFDRVGDHFYEDCRVFLSKFKTKESLRFDAFAEVWQEMKFSFILSQWKYLGEMQEIVEEYLKVCKKIWLKSEPVEERVCGLYLLRAIYLKQPAAQYVKITLSHEDWQWMKHFLYVIKDFVQNETRYILQELFDLNAFTFSVPDCTPMEGKDDGGLSESVVTEFTKAHTFYNEMFLTLQQENNEYKEQRRACLRVYPELRSFANAETDSLVERLMGRLTVFEKEVSKIRRSLPGSNVAPGSSLRQDESATEETGGRRPTRRTASTYRVRAVADGCETEESSESEDENNLDMPYLPSEDSDEDEEDEESCDAPTVRSFHMSDFDLSSASSEDDERAPRCSTATGLANAAVNSVYEGASASCSSVAAASEATPRRVRNPRRPADRRRGLRPPGEGGGSAVALRASRRTGCRRQLEMAAPAICTASDAWLDSFPGFVMSDTPDRVQCGVAGRQGLQWAAPPVNLPLNTVPRIQSSAGTGKESSSTRSVYTFPYLSTICRDIVLLWPVHIVIY